MHALTEFVFMADHRLRVLIASALTLITGYGQSAAAPPLADKFGIHIAELSGRNHRQIATSSWQQMSHPRVSPDHEWITFTRYTKKNFSGIAEELGGYEGSEIMLMKLDGSDMKTLIPAKSGIMNCVSSWADDGRSIIWLSTDNPDKTPSIMKIDVASGAITRVPTPKDFKTTDPHSVGNVVVFPVIEKKVDSLWIMNIDGSNLRRLTEPPAPTGFRWGALPAGDYDPKLSPDAKHVAFMRLTSRDDWRAWTVDVETREERNLSGPDNTDIVPDWSSDGKLIAFSHLNTKDFRKMGIYTIRPDGTDRKLLPLPRGYVCNQPQFFPGEGSRPNTRIIYQTMKVPGMP